MGSGFSAMAGYGPASYEEDANNFTSPSNKAPTGRDDGQGQKPNGCTSGAANNNMLRSSALATPGAHDNGQGQSRNGSHNFSKRKTLPSSQPSPVYYNIEDIENSDMDTVADFTDKESCKLMSSTKIGRKLALVRQAETMNEAFPCWYDECVNNDHYNAKDLNHPVRLPMRSRGFHIYKTDPPITRLAEHAAKILGKALASEKIKWETVITAPELASVQTGSAIALSTIGDKTFISVDETLCDLSHRSMDFMTAMELMKMDVSARIMQPIRSKENVDDSLGRVVGGIDNVQRSNSGNLIIVVGPTAYETILQQLLGYDRRKMKKLKTVPPLACTILEKGTKSWTLRKEQILPITTNHEVYAAFNPYTYIEK